MLFTKQPLVNLLGKRKSSEPDEKEHKSKEPKSIRRRLNEHVEQKETDIQKDQQENCSNGEKETDAEAMDIDENTKLKKRFG